MQTLPYPSLPRSSRARADHRGRAPPPTWCSCRGCAVPIRWPAGHAAPSHSSRVREMFVPLSSTKTSCSGSSWAAASRQAVRASSSRSLAASVFFYASSPGGEWPATSSLHSAAGRGAPPTRHSAPAPWRRRPPPAAPAMPPPARGQCGAGSREWACAPASPSRAACTTARLTVFTADVKAASGFSHGLTVSHRSYQSFFQVGRIRTHTWGHCITLPATASRKLL